MSTPIPLSEFIELVDRDEELHRLRDDVARQEAEIEALTVERDNALLAGEGETTALAEQYDLLRAQVEADQGFAALLQEDYDGVCAELNKTELHIEELERELSHVAAVPLDDKITDLTAFIAELREWLALSRAEASELRKRNSDQARKITKLNEADRTSRTIIEQWSARRDIENSRHEKELDEQVRLANKEHNAVLVELAAAKADRDRYRAKARRKILTPRFQVRLSDGVADIAFGLLILALIIGLAVAAIISTS